MNVIALIVSFAAAAAAIAAAIYARELGHSARRASDLLADQVREQIRASEFERSAVLVANNPTASRGGAADRPYGQYQATIRNVGRAPATDCVVWIELVPPPGQSESSARIGPEKSLGGLGPDRFAKFIAAQSLAGGGVERAAVIVARWRDGNGTVDRREIGQIDVWL